MVAQMAERSRFARTVVPVNTKGMRTNRYGARDPDPGADPARQDLSVANNHRDATDCRSLVHKIRTGRPGAPARRRVVGLLLLILVPTTSVSADVNVLDVIGGVAFFGGAGALVAGGAWYYLDGGIDAPPNETRNALILGGLISFGVVLALYIGTAGMAREAVDAMEQARDEVLAEQRAEQEQERRRQREAAARRQRQREAAAQRQREAEAQQQREAEAQQQREAEAQRQREAEAQQQREAEAQQQREAEAQQQREAEAQQQREAEAQQQREAEAQRQREPEAQRQREPEAQRQREPEAQRQREPEAQRQREPEAQRQREAEAQQQREAEAQRQREAEAQRQREAEAQRQREARCYTKLGAEPGLQLVEFDTRVNSTTGVEQVRYTVMNTSDSEGIYGSVATQDIDFAMDQTRPGRRESSTGWWTASDYKVVIGYTNSPRGSMAWVCSGDSGMTVTVDSDVIDWDRLPPKSVNIWYFRPDGRVIVKRGNYFVTCSHAPGRACEN